ncbi:MAG: hypothetical protein AB8B96_11030 [Lysobacterales bacterium]
MNNVAPLMALFCLLLSADAFAGSCGSGPAPADVASGNLAPAPAESFQPLCLQVVNDRPVDRDEIAFSAVPLPASFDVTDTRRLAVVTGERLLAAQFQPLSRWGAPLADANAPIRWLGISLPVQLGPDTRADYSLRLYDAPVLSNDPLAITVTEQTGVYTVDTGAARFTVDPAHPALLTELLIQETGETGVLLYEAGPSAGPRLVLTGSTSGPTALGAEPLAASTSMQRLFANGFEANSGGPAGLSSSAAAQVDPGSFALVESGPVKVVMKAHGHFVDPNGTSVCSPGTATPYESLGYTVAMSFFRGRRDVGLEFEFRNECSDALTGPWTDQTLNVDEVSWQFPLVGAPTQTTVTGTTLDLGEGFARVAQHRGNFANGPWQRRASVTREGQTRQTAENFDQPVVGWTDARWIVGLSAAWIQYREPQALEVSSSGLRFNAVDGHLTVGEGKGIWNHALLSINARSAQPLSSQLADLGRRSHNFLERGLLPQVTLRDVNRANVFPSLGTQASSNIKTAYLGWMNLLHQQTIGDTGQLLRNGSIGSQLWPDTGSADSFDVDAQSPNNISSGMNYWDPAGNELLEYLRSGQPRWAWDFALAGYRTQLHAAYLNTGNHRHGNRAGLAVTSGGPGCEQFQPPCATDGTGGGQWHRSAFGSDDYTYAMSAELGYVIRPTVGMLERFAQAGATVFARYDPTIPEANREAFVNAVNITRQVIQHLEMLANCAEFVPGQQGIHCDTRLHQMVGELARDNLAAGILCQGATDFGNGISGDIPGPPSALPTQCATPQQFMQNALMLPFFHRYFTNYGNPPEGSISRALARSAQVLYQQGLAQQANGALIAQGDWAARLDCTLNDSGTDVVSCQPTTDSDLMTAMSPHTRPHTAAMLLIGHEIDPSINLCAITRSVLDEQDFAGSPDNFAGGWNGVGHFNQAGWWKGSAQMLQQMIFGVGIYDTCQ